mmetsp:Transcript_57366/g.174706  ORF Transcript_57366/g.174706 Transcript_57366/m.174706 type:complete len:105 (-) Transcript_57366:3776-4090(-)
MVSTETKMNIPMTTQINCAATELPGSSNKAFKRIRHVHASRGMPDVSALQDMVKVSERVLRLLQIWATVDDITDPFKPELVRRESEPRCTGTALLEYSEKQEEW